MRMTVFILLLLTSVSVRAQEACMQPDVNCDGYVNVNDLLGLLGYFGDEDLDGDGIWDSQDVCIEDECGVCDGPGPQVLAVDTITFTIDSIFVEAISEWYVYEVADTTFILLCDVAGCMNEFAENYNPLASEDDGSCYGIDPCENQSFIVFNDYDYVLVAIGEQCWFAENLRTEYYTNGDSINSIFCDSDWTSAIGGTQVYGQGLLSCNSFSPDGNACDPNWSLEQYGRMYNWYAVNDSRGLCPNGWSVPTNEQWVELEEYLVDDDSTGFIMKTEYGWDSEGNGNNAVGFSGLPGGYISVGGSSHVAGRYAYWWSSTQVGDEAYVRNLLYSYTTLLTGYYDLNYGFSVRCLKD